MQPNKIEDPRGPWAMARRTELVRYAKELGINDISEQMPKELIVNRLQARNVPPPKVPPRQIGAPARAGDTSPTSHHFQGSPPQAAEIVEIEATVLAEREWAAQQAAPPLPQGDPIDSMSFNEMRRECKNRGIKLSRRDRPADLRAKLRGQQNPAQ